MIESIDIKNFRCFDSLNLSRLKRINIITGQNASGKTALLEALYITAGASPELVFRTKTWRGIIETVVPRAQSAYEALWRDLFFQFDQNRDIYVTLKGSLTNTRSLLITYKPIQDSLIPLATSPSSPADNAPIASIMFEWTDGSGRKFSAQPQAGVATFGFKFQGEAAPMPSALYSSAYVPTQSENAKYFSNFSVKNEESTFVECIREEFPFINDLSVEAYITDTPTIYASVTGFSEKIPTNMLSTGITKLLALILGIANQPNGVILIDEIENGFYYDRLRSVWKLLLKFSKIYDVQIFATTHSAECLEAAAECAKGKEDDFCLMRAEKINGKSTIKQFTGKAFRAAVSQAAEIR